MKSFMTSLVAVVLVACTASFASAVTVLLEDFDDVIDSLEGETANTGQVWADSWSTNDLQGGTNYGQGGTKGAGSYPAGSPGPWAVNEIFYSAITTGPIVASIDTKREYPGSNRMGPTLLRDTVAAAGIAMSWWDSNTLNVEGGLVPNTTISSPVFSSTDVHFDLTVDLIAKTASLSWHEVGNTGNNGSQNLGSYGGAFAPNTASLLVYGNNSVQGFDNFQIEAIPEPTSIAMVCVSGLLVCIRRRRW
jgi:hypothetical protein